MKNIYSIIFTVLLFSSAYAQPVITNSITPEIDDSWTITFMEVGSFDTGSTGANQTWDFSGLNTDNAIDIVVQILDPNSINGGPSYPNAQFVWHIPVFEIYNYYEVTEDSLSLIGGASISGGQIDFETVFNDPEDGMQFPITFGDNYNYYSYFEQFFTGTSLGSHERNGTVQADAYGTVITPKGTYDNILRLKITETSFGFTNTQYAWYDVNNFVPVFLYEESNDPDTPSSLYFSEPDINSTNTNQAILSETVWNAWYSSTEHQIKFDLPAEAPGAQVQLSLYTLNGKLITSKSFHEPQGDYYLNLPKGTSCSLIIATMETSKATWSKKVSVCRSY